MKRLSVLKKKFGLLFEWPLKVGFQINSWSLFKYHARSCQNVCDVLTFLLDNIFIRFGTELYRQVVGIPMGTNCAPLVADLFLFVMRGTL